MAVESLSGLGMFGSQQSCPLHGLWRDHTRGIAGGHATGTAFIHFLKIEPIGLEFDAWHNRELGVAWGGTLSVRWSLCTQAEAGAQGRGQPEVRLGSRLLPLIP